MKNNQLGLVYLIASFVVAAAGAGAENSPERPVGLEEINRFKAAYLSGPGEGKTSVEKLRNATERRLEFMAMCEAYAATAPKELDRATVILAMKNYLATPILEIDEAYNGHADAIGSAMYVRRNWQERRKQYQRYLGLLKSVRDDRTLAGAIRCRALDHFLAVSISAGIYSDDAGELMDLRRELSADLETPTALAKKLCSYAALAGVPRYRTFLETWARRGQPAILPVVREHQEELSRFEDHARDIRFTALDGRPVDVAKLSGKVVLVDFWSTTCGPCVAQLPEIRAFYEKYRAAGFEVVGITCEEAGLKENDSDEVKVKKITAGGVILRKFIAEADLPWPNYYDGRWDGNPLVAKFAVQSIPVTFLIDQQGKVVLSEARGEALERELIRLLDEPTRKGAQD